MNSLKIIDETPKALIQAGIFHSYGELEASKVGSLLDEYSVKKCNILKIEKLATMPEFSIMNYFMEGNSPVDSNGCRGHLPASLFESKGAISALDAEYWDKALRATDVLACMPSAREQEWYESIKFHTAPEFKAESVVSTLSSLLSNRALYLAERIELVFNSLSDTHLTNSPWGFSKRMIIKDVVRQPYFNICSTKTGVIDDLRILIGAMTGRNSIDDKRPRTYDLINLLEKSFGQWVAIDGNSIRIKLFKKGTVHIEIHPDAAWRLNETLALLHPKSIPASSRVLKENPAFAKTPILKTIPNDVLYGLQHAFQRYNNRDQGLYLSDSYLTGDTREKAIEVVKAIGGVCSHPSGSFYEFSYNPQMVFNHIFITAVLPDWTDHQFFPTKESLSKEVMAKLDIQPNDNCLEPQAGQGGLAKYMPIDSTLVELSSLNCTILKANGYKDVHCADFLKWAIKEKSNQSFSKIALNPPFAKNQSVMHLKAASSLLAPDGRLVAILPSSLAGKDIIKGMRHEWSNVYHNEFDGTGVSVVILTLT